MIRAAVSILMLSCLVAPMLPLSAQTSLNNINKDPDFTLGLKLMNRTGENGSTLTWSPKYRKYYSIIAGNPNFPFEVLDEAGNHLQMVAATRDLRGIWYFEDDDQLEGNVYQTHHIAAFRLDANGLVIPNDVNDDSYRASSVSNPNVPLVYDPRNYQYAWFDAGSQKIQLLNAIRLDKDGEVKVDIQASQMGNFNEALVYTDIVGAEYGLYNYSSHQLFLFDRKTGKNAAKITLPDDVPFCYDKMIGFANGHFWLYDNDIHAWLGYKVY